MAARIPHAFADEVLGPGRTGAAIDAGRHCGVVAEGDVDGSVRAGHHAVRAVLAAVVLPFEDALLLLVGAVAVCVAEAPEAGGRAGGGRIHPEIIASNAEALRAGRYLGHGGDVGFLGRVGSDPRKLDAQRGA